MINPQAQIQIRARLDEISIARQFVLEMGRQAGLDEKSLHHCQLAVDEACTNIIEHGYGEATDSDQTISLTCSYGKRNFTIEIVDSGIRFDPLIHITPDPTNELTQREPGGWGLYFIKELMDDVHYEYRDARNHLTLTKLLPEPGTAQTNRKGNSHQVVVTGLADNLEVFELTGAIDSQASQKLEQQLVERITTGRKYLVLDMAGVDHISSGGLKMLVAVWKRAHDVKGDLALAGLQPPLLEVMKMIGFDLVLKIFDSQESAISHYVD